MSLSWLEDTMSKILDERDQKGSLRIYKDEDDENPTGTGASTPTSKSDQQKAIDFSTNDYLGLARSKEQKDLVESRYQSLLNLSSFQDNDEPTLGATGSRLLSGDSAYARHLERRLAKWHNRSAALVCNSGYDANLSVLSCLPCDRFLFDEYSHNSLRMGMRLSRTFQDKSDEVSGIFRHNDTQDLRRKLKDLYYSQQQYTNHANKLRVLIVVESVYSMDGDVAPLREILDLAQQYGALVVVDEAHGLGIFGDDSGPNSRGTGVLTQFRLEHHPALACSVHTFGKAAGCHGAVVCGSKTLRQYLWNYGWPLIYSTSLPLHSLVAIECSYETMTGPRGKQLRQHVNQLVQYFRHLVEDRITNLHQEDGNNHNQTEQMYLLPSMSAIQALVLPRNGNQACSEFCKCLWDHSRQTIRLYPIKSPTVPAGMERIRIILHGHNTKAEVDQLVEYMVLTLIDTGILSKQSASGVAVRRNATNRAALPLSKL